DSVNLYKSKNGFPTGSSPLITSTVETLKWEKDLTYQRLGHANNDNRDYWYWAYTEARNRAPFRDFVFYITDSIAFQRNPNKPEATLRVGMHGLTNTTCATGNGHDVTIKLNTKTVGVKQWNGQEPAL